MSITTALLLLTTTLSSDASGSDLTRVIRLPEPGREGGEGLDTVLRARRSVRDFTRDPLTLDSISRLLWAGQGVTHPEGLRTAPSAGALYPLELYVVSGAVTGMSEGIYRYRPDRHELVTVEHGDRRPELSGAALGQKWVGDAAAVVVITAVYERTTRKYGERGKRYVHMEVGHAAQNMLLEATALGLGAVVVGAFEDEAVRRLLHLSEEERPLGLVAVGIVGG